MTIVHTATPFRMPLRIVAGMDGPEWVWVMEAALSGSYSERMHFKKDQAEFIVRACNAYEKNKE